MQSDLRELTLTDLENLTGFSFKTIKKRLQGLDPLRHDGKSIFYEPKMALGRLYGSKALTKNEELTEARTKLAEAQAQKTELEHRKMAGELLEAAEVEQEYSRLVMACRSKLLALPSRLAPSLINTEEPALIESQLRTVIHEALRELAHGVTAD